MYKIYNVQDGDTIYTVADKTGITVDELKRLNGLTNNEITTGMQLVIPSINSYIIEYQIKQGDTIYELARKYNTNYLTLLRLNGLNKNDYIYPGQKILVPNEGVKIYITEPNDTIDAIASKLNTTSETVINQNEDIYLLPEQLIVYSAN